MTELEARFQEFLACESARAARHKADIEAVAKLEGKTVTRAEADLCQKDYAQS